MFLLSGCRNKVSGDGERLKNCVTLRIEKRNSDATVPFYLISSLDIRRFVGGMPSFGSGIRVVPSAEGSEV